MWMEYMKTKQKKRVLLLFYIENKTEKTCPFTFYEYENWEGRASLTVREAALDKRKGKKEEWRGVGDRMDDAMEQIN